MAKAADYMDNVNKYDGGANEAVVQKICNYLGIALTNKTLLLCLVQIKPKSTGS